MEDGLAAGHPVGGLRFAHPPYGLMSQGTEMMRYAVVIEKAGGNYSAYVPDLPGTWLCEVFRQRE